MKYISLTLFVLAAVLINSCSQVRARYNYSDVISNQWNSTEYEKQRYAIGMASLKGFHGSVYYLGTDEKYHYFKVEKYTGFFRVKKSAMNLKKIFLVGDEDSYKVHVPYY